jgi:methionyl aminopeptidase
MEEEKIIKAGKIAVQVKEYAKSIIKEGTPLLEIAEKIDKKIHELGGKPAFPVNLCMDNIAAHYTPSHDDKTLAGGLLKVDIGIHIDGWIADTAFSLDLENSAENKKLIQASEKALENVEKIISKKTTLLEIGKLVEKTINAAGFNPIANLSGHSMEQYDLHAGISIPNVDNNSNIELETGLYAIEPFATNGNGKIHDGVTGNIYILANPKNHRNPFAREVLEYIGETYGQMPFASRWVIKKFGTRALLALRQLESEEILHHYPTLVEEKGKLVSQAENTFLIRKDKVIVTTK